MSDPSFECPNCGKAYRWQSKIAGKKVKCACTQKFRVPMSSTGDPEPDGPLVGQRQTPAPSNPAAPAPKPKPAAPEPDPYELDLPDDAPAGDTAPISARSPSAAQSSGGGKCPSCNSPLRPGAVICLNCGFNVAAGSKLKTVVEADPPGEQDTPAKGRGGESFVSVPAAVGEERVAARTKLQDDLAADTAKRHHFQEKTLPMILIGIGFAFLLINTMVLAPKVMDDWGLASTGEARVAAIIDSGLLFVIQLPCLFIGILIISSLFGSAFGSLTDALKKLTTLALLGGQFDQFLDLIFFITMGFGAVFAIIFKICISFGVFWVVAKQLFDDLEPTETAVLWLAMLLIPGFVLTGLQLFF